MKVSRRTQRILQRQNKEIKAFYTKLIADFENDLADEEVIYKVNGKVTESPFDYYNRIWLNFATRWNSNPRHATIKLTLFSDYALNDKILPDASPISREVASGN